MSQNTPSQLKELIEASIQLELNVSELYTIFYKVFSQDSEFWWRLVLEEKNHAALFKSGIESGEVFSKFPENLVIQELDILNSENANLRKLIDDYNLMPPTRDYAFNLALEIENSAVEIHFQQFMEEENNSVIDKIFQELNKADKDHVQRIFNYMQENGIPVTEENMMLMSAY
ncbi:MAG: rubrerythrin family protein [Gammaproteobacteria bacterium]|nr:MAG: rubrerythrin family protein [Gammaproteobacteria bacterium]